LEIVTLPVTGIRIFTPGPVLVAMPLTVTVQPSRSSGMPVVMAVLISPSSGQPVACAGGMPPPTSENTIAAQAAMVVAIRRGLDGHNNLTVNMTGLSKYQLEKVQQKKRGCREPSPGSELIN
jgi:hypothetical protein